MGKAGLLALLLAVAGTQAAAGERVFTVDSSQSRLVVAVSRGGLFGFAGHNHEVVATGVFGTIVANDEDVARSTVTLRFLSAGLSVSGKGEPPEDVPKVQAKMAGPEVLDVARFAAVEFRSTAVEGRRAPDETWNLRVTGELTIRGVARKLTLPLRVQLQGDELLASGQAVIKQTDFGIKPISIAGVVKVKDALGIDYKIVGKAGP